MINCTRQVFRFRGGFFRDDDDDSGEYMVYGVISKVRSYFGTCKKTAKTDATYQDLIRTDYTVLRWIIHFLSESTARCVSYVTSSKQLWEELNERYNKSNAPLLFK
ncbi:hypothetical protein RND81_09G021600 [Saponaria officinalis]|uniref:Uncharacterized protein n=1 Tax=Saponaria officinalis TaxID=3572 RepID=A0AAW1IG01_SAPOF